MRISAAIDLCCMVLSFTAGARMGLMSFKVTSGGCDLPLSEAADFSSPRAGSSQLPSITELAYNANSGCLVGVLDDGGVGAWDCRT